MILEAKLNSANEEFLKCESEKANLEKDITTLKYTQD